MLGSAADMAARILSCVILSVALALGFSLPLSPRGKRKEGRGKRREERGERKEERGKRREERGERREERGERREERGGERREKPSGPGAAQGQAQAAQDLMAATDSQRGPKLCIVCQYCDRDPTVLECRRCGWRVCSRHQSRRYPDQCSYCGRLGPITLPTTAHRP